jgi:cobalt-zinc-cadmium efflux system outer membrane protein
MGRVAVLAFCLVGLLTPSLTAQGLLPPALRERGEPLTLQRLEELADQYHPILPRDRAQIDAARGQATQAGMWNNPRFDTNNPQVFNGRNTALNAGFQQEIPVMGKKRLDQAAANEVARQQEFNLAQDRYSLLTAIRQQFYQVLSDQQRIQVLRQMVEVLEKSYRTGEDLKKGGLAAEIDLVPLRIEWRRAVGNLQSSIRLLESDRKQLSDLVGLPGLVDRDVVGEFTGDYPIFDKEQLERYVTQQHTQVRIAQAVIAQSKTQLRRAEVEPFPNPYMGPAYQYGLVPGLEQFWFNIQFDIPVLNRNQGGIRAARGNLRASEENLVATQYNLLNQAHNLIGQYEAARAIVAEFEKNILPDSREGLQKALDAYAKRTMDLATFLTVQRSVVQANSDYLDALNNLWSNAVQLAGLLQLDRFR